MPDLFVYALVVRPAKGVNVRGVAGETLQTVRVGRVHAIVGRVRAVPKPTDRNLRRYAHVMSALWRRAPALLPARFGTSAAGLTELNTMIRPRQRTLLRSLRVVRNRAQMTVRLVTNTDDSTAEIERSSGTSYLRSRQRAQAVPAFAPLRAAVRPWIRDERVEKRTGVASIYHLIPRGSADRYRSAIERAARDEGITMIVSGPWPPHAFADTW